MGLSKQVMKIWGGDANPNSRRNAWLLAGGVFAAWTYFSGTYLGDNTSRKILYGTYDMLGIKYVDKRLEFSNSEAEEWNRRAKVREEEKKQKELAAAARKSQTDGGDKTV